MGSGYVGLTTGACLADADNDVICTDVDARRIEGLRRGSAPFHEPGLDALLERNLALGRLRFTTDTAKAVRASETVFIAVGTPGDDEGSADVGGVLAAAREIGRAMDGERIVVVKSTTPVGTTRRVEEAIAAETDHDFSVCCNPEFLREGTAVEDFRRPDRVVLGVDDPKAAAALRDLHAPFARAGAEVLIMDPASAEVTKYAANAMLAMRVSYMNLIAGLCERAGADVDHVRVGVGSDPRIGSAFLFPGVGYGGSCFPKDVRALARTLARRGLDASLVEAVESVNRRQTRLLLRRVRERFGEDLRGRVFALWGLAFKPGTDDMREAPSLTTIRGLLERGARVTAHDPVAVGAARAVLGDAIAYSDDAYEALDGADALLIHTECPPYRSPDFARMRALLARPLILDGRNLYRPSLVADSGFEYVSVGRPTRARARAPAAA